MELEIENFPDPRKSITNGNPSGQHNGTIDKQSPVS